MIEKRKTGIDFIGDAPWGTHFCQFYKTKKDLTDILVPYFKAGLKNNEFCLWVTSEPLKVEDAKRSLRKAVKNLDEYIKTGQIEILDYSQWYTKTGKFDADKVLKGLVEKEKQAIEKGFDGLRLTGNISWLEKRDWKSFVDYEVMVNNVIHNYKMLAICSYSLDKYKAPEILDVMGVHQFVIINRNGKWTIIESTERKWAEESLKQLIYQHQLILDAAGEGIVGLDLEGKITFANPFALKTTGYDIKELIEQELHKLVHYKKPDGTPYPREECPSYETLKNGIPKNIRNDVFFKKDGTSFPVRYTSTPIREQDKIVGAVVTFHDITERKRAEEMLQHQRDALNTHTRILSAILRTRDLDKLLNTILEEVMFFLQVEFGCIHLVQGDDLVLCCWKGFSDTSRAHLLSFSAENPPDWMRKLLFTKEQLSEYGIMPSFAKREGIQSWTCIPLELPPLREGETTKWLGTLILCSRGVNALDKERIETLEIISHKIALAIDRAQSYRDAQERLFRLQALRDIDKAIIRQLDLREVMNVVLERVPEELGADAAAVSLFDEKQQRIKIFAMRLPNGTIIEEEVFTLAESLLHWFVDKKEPVIIYNLLQDPRIQMNRNHLRNAGIVSYLGVPLIAQDKTLGILHILTTKPMVFRDEDVEFFRILAGQIAIALENARVTEALRKSEEKYRTIFGTTGTATAIVEEDTTISLVNKEFEKLSGYSKEEIEGKKSLIEFVVKEDLQRIKNYHYQRRVDPDAAPRNYEFKFIDRQGNVNDILVSIDIIPETKKSVASLLDITERKQAEESLRQSEDRYRSLVENVKDVIFTVSPDSLLTSLNVAFETITGWSCAEWIGKSFKPIIYPGDLSLVMSMFQRTLQGEIPSIFELRILTKSGEYAVGEFKVTPKIQKGSIVGILGIARDITEHKKLKEQLLHAQKMEAIGQLAGGVAHDFNNILTAIVGYSSLLQMKMSKDDTLRHNVDQILASTERAANLVRSLLAFSRKHIIDLKPVKLNETIKRVEKLLSRVISEDIEFKTILTDEDLTIMADSGQIEQVLMNLATNARDAMPDGGLITIETKLVELGEEYIETHGYGKPGMYALISVTDTGEGMDENIREKIFEPFFTTKEVGKGTGPGLSMAYGIIKQHNGYINVYSEFGKGTTFKIYLPLTTAEVEERKPTEPTITISGTETILLAEDDADVRTFTKSVLEEFGYTVIEAGNGEDAVKRFIENKDKVQLLLLDVIMPKKNGKEVYER